MQNKQIKSYTALDVGKFLCALLILFYHYFSERDSAPALLEEALSLYAVAVALFMAISGFLTFSKLEGMEERADRWNYVKKQVKRIFQIYLLWSIPYLIFTICRWDFATLTPEFVFWKVQGWIFHTTFSTIWFLPALAIGLLVAFFVTEKFSSKTAVTLAVLMYILSSLTGTYKFAGNEILGMESFAAFSKLWLGGNRGGLLFGFPLIMLGRFAAQKKFEIQWKCWALLTVIATGALLAEALTLRYFAGNTGIDQTVMMIPIVFCALQFLLTFSLPSGSYAVYMRKMSVLIFVTQRIFLTVIPALLSEEMKQMLFSNIWIGAVLLCGGTFAFSSLIIALSNRILWLKKLY